MTQPNLYDIGLLDTCFNPSVFWFWYFSAVWQSAMLLFLSFKTLGNSESEEVHPDGIEFSKTVNGSLEVNGAFLFQAIVVLVNIKIFLHSNTMSFFSMFWQFGSIALFYIFFFVFSLSPEFELFQILPTLFSFENQYFLLGFFIIGYSLIEYGLNMVERKLNNEAEEIKAQIRRAELEEIQK